MLNLTNLVNAYNLGYERQEKVIEIDNAYSDFVFGDMSRLKSFELAKKRILKIDDDYRSLNFLEIIAFELGHWSEF